MPSHLDDLNFEQREAVSHSDGPLLILAGAGAGKTKVLTHRMLHLIKKGVAPHHILAITFTNKAAKEMRERVDHLLRTDKNLNFPISFAERPFISTFHSLGVHILKEYGSLAGLKRHFTIYDRSDSLSTVREAIKAEGLDPKRFEPSKILSVISREKGNTVTLEGFEETAGDEYFSGIVASVWRHYEKALRDESALDFDDLLLKTVILLGRHPEIREKYVRLWQYLHIDEYQDTNRVQYQISKLLTETHRNICVVGDVDQNIYSWRGADIRNILDFEKDYPDARVIRLEKNYRSTKIILTVANEIIKKNKRRREKNLYTDNVLGDKILLFEGYDETDEAHFTAEQAKTLIISGTPASEIAVLYRANFQSRVLEEAMLAHDVPYQVLGTRFFERREVKDLLSYMRAAFNPASIADLKRILNVPARGIGKVTMLKIFAGKETELIGKTRDAIVSFRKTLSDIQETIAQLKPSEIVRFVLKRSGIEAALKGGTDDDLERLENLYELVTLATTYDYLSGEEGVEKLLENAALASDQDEMKEEKEAVRLMTVHASKGLEFEHVFIIGLEEDLFPHRSLAEDDLSDERSEEERRLFYVALTRAKKRLTITFAAVRTIFGSRRINVPSQFLSDIDESHVETAERGAGTLGRKKIIWFK